MTDYILFVLQEGNFQSRSMLVPAESFLKVREEEYKMLKDFSVKTAAKILGDEYVVIDNLIIQKIIFNNNIGSYEKKPYTSFCSNLMTYADGLSDDCYLDMKDQEWYDNSVINLCEGFEHVRNYVECKNLNVIDEENINIIDSFLILEKTVHTKSNKCHKKN
mgnify:CR=1 FL=1